ncbi:MAG: class I SAM-dependent methyltransferase, partial [Anaerolineaceae bacterium]
MEFFKQHIPAVRTILLKSRGSESSPADRRGIFIHGNQPANQVRENGIWYALDLCMNQDASLYLDTRLLRAWLLENAGGKDVLNTFAYTGSLGIAAAAGGANKVVQGDLSRRFLALANQSAALNQITGQQHR